MIVVYIILGLSLLGLILERIEYHRLPPKRQKAYDRALAYRMKKEEEKRESDKKIDELNSGFLL